MTLRVIPLGGLGEIGMNLMVYECGDEAILIDCGMMFPESALGIDVIIPDMSYVFENPSRFKGLFLTHGHEDHVGAVPFLIGRVPMPVFGLPLTIGFMRDKLREFALEEAADLRIIQPRQVVQVGSFSVEPLLVTHSTIDSAGFAITTPLGTIIHTGDFKIDHTPVDGRRTDLARFAEYGERGVLLLVSDSTNILFPGHCPSERTVLPTIERIVEHAPGRVLVTTFSSHMHRLQQLFDLAERHQRRAEIVGRSMIRNVATAERLGYFKRRRSPASTRSAAEVELVMITGSQGEPRAALSRAAVNENRSLQIGRKDTVVFSARIIPGNERAIGRVIDNLCRCGAKVYSHEIPGVHASGHAYDEELKMILGLVRPKYFIPMHGTVQFLVEHAELARVTGIPEDNIAVITNGEVAEIGPEGLRKLPEPVPHGKVYIDSESEEIPGVVVRDRQHLAEDGFVIAIVAMGSTGELVREIEIITRGVLHVDANLPVLQEMRALLGQQLHDSTLYDRLDRAQLQEGIRATLKRYFRKKFGRRPLILPIVWEM